MTRVFLLSVGALSLCLSITLRSDDILLKNGDVLEGKVDDKATADANRGKPPGNWILIYNDESGKRQTIQYDEVKHIARKKPSWEVRAENIGWYQKEASKVKDNFSSQNAFARRCKQKSLDEEATKHFRRAYELRKEESKDKEGDSQYHIDMAKWCDKAGLPEEERQEYKAAFELKKKELTKEATTVKAYTDLAVWCKKAELEEEAIQCYEEILMIDPTHAISRKAIDDLKSSIQYKLKSMITEYDRATRGWKITVAIEDDADPKFLEEWKAKMVNLSQFVFECTEGQFFMTEIRIEDQSSNGRIIVEKGKKDWAGMNQAQASGVLAYCTRSGTPRWEVHCPGKTWESVLCHEMFHGVFGLLDEYYQNPQCPCIMRSAPNPQKLCNPETHLGGGRQKEPCWDTIKRRYKDVVSPNPKWKFTKTGIPGRGRAEEVDGVLDFNGITVEKAPEPKVIIQDN